MAHSTGKKASETGKGNSSNNKVGGSSEAARQFGGKNDFGIPVKQARPHEMRPDVGGKDVEDHADDHRALGEVIGEGQRTKGVGTNRRHKPGSGSGGDVDTDIIGLGDGGNTMAANPVSSRMSGPDMVTEDVRRGRRHKDKDQSGSHAIGPKQVSPGSVVDRGDRVDGVEDVASEGADSAIAGHYDGVGDDAAAGEISSDEATGRNDEGD